MTALGTASTAGYAEGGRICTTIDAFRNAVLLRLYCDSRGSNGVKLRMNRDSCSTRAVLLQCALPQVL